MRKFLGVLGCIVDAVVITGTIVRFIRDWKEENKRLKEEQKYLEELKEELRKKMENTKKYEEEIN